MLDKFAEELKAARENNNLTLQQIAAKSRIDFKFLQAMENGDFTFLPDIYVKAFIKDYSNIVGLDPELSVKKFDAAKQGKIYEEEAGEPELKKDLSKKSNSPLKPSPDAGPSQKPTYESPILKTTFPESSSRTNKKIIMIGGILLAVIFLGAIIYFVMFNGDTEIIVPEKPIEEVIEDSKQRFEEEPFTEMNDTINSGQGISSSDSLNLNIRARDTSWVKIIFDDKRVEEFTLFPNSQKTIKAAGNFKITFGKSSVISLQLNDQTLNFTPKNPNVSYVMINEAGLQFLQTAPTLSQN